MPKVSIVMSVYNAQAYVANAIQSILNQTYGDFEFIMVNDGSTDKTQDILASFSDPRIKVLTQENRGLTKSLNRAIQEARGIYIARMDADDISLPQRLEKQVSYLDTHPDIVMCGTQCDIYQVPCTHGDIKKIMLFHNPFVHPSIMIRSAVLKKNPYNESFVYMQDYELWTRIVPFYKTANLSETLLYYKKNTEGITALKKKTLSYKTTALYIRILFITRLFKSITHKPLGK